MINCFDNTDNGINNSNIFEIDLFIVRNYKSLCKETVIILVSIV